VDPVSPLLLPLLLVVAVAVPLAVARAHRLVDPGLVVEWAEAHHLGLTPANRPMVSWYLRTARILRTWGAVGGIVLPALFALAWSGHLEVLGYDTAGGANPGDVSWIFVGYLIGVLYAEMSLVRPMGGARRSASLVPRNLEDYLPGRVLRTQRALGGAIVVGVLLSLALPYEEPFIAPGPVATAVFLVWITAFVLGLERVQRWLVRRPQPFTDASLVAADDAIRSQSVHSVAGAGLGILLLMFAGTCALLGASDVAILRWTLWVPALASTLLALFACRYFGHRPWRVRRPPFTREAPAPG
jgi:hypothetical protein